MEQTQELYQFKGRQEYIAALDSVMPENYHRTRKLGGNRSTTYLPIPIQEAVADMMWHEWNVVDESYQIFVNEIVCTVKIAYTPSYPGANEQFCTGSASKPIQMKSGSTVESFPNAKQQNALEYNIPSAKKTAIGNALEGVGNIFGRNIGREIDGQKLPSNFALRKPQETENNEKNKSESDK